MKPTLADNPVEKRYRYIVDRSREFITLINRNYVYEIANESYCQAVERGKDEIVGRTVADVWGHDLFETTLKGYIDRCLTGESVSYIQRFKFGSSQRYMHVNYYPYTDETSEVTHALVYSHDITRLGDLEAQLIQYEYRDPLTGLFNRKSLNILLDMEILKAQQGPQDESLRGLLFIGIENLTDINRRLGHSIGNFVLENTGIRIKESTRNSDSVFRFQDNELAVVLSHLAKSTDIAMVAQKIVRAVSTPYRYQNDEIHLVCRVGAAVYPNDGEDEETLIRCAVTALHEAVRSNQPFKLYDRRLHTRVSRRFEMEGQLRHAFEENQFELYFQPIMKADGVIEGAEALIRWNLPERGVVQPGEFLPLAEAAGVMGAVSRWAIFAAAREIARIQERFPIYITVNLTAQDFESDGLLDLVQSALIQNGTHIVPSRLKLEITESDSMRRADMAIMRMQMIQKLGVDIFVDDFGTGNSSLAYLKTLPAPTVKIDKSFIDALVERPEDASFLEYIVHLVKLRGKRIIAEGVTTIEQIDILRNMGCDSLQGFFYAQPLPTDAFESFVERHFASVASGRR